MASARGSADSRKPSSATTSESRNIRRAKSRLMVRFGTTAQDRTAFTRNVSESGLFLHTNQVQQPGTKVQLTVQFPDRVFTLQGEVVWAKRVPPQLAHLLECGMGIRFVGPGPEWLEFYETWKRRYGV